MSLSSIYYAIAWSLLIIWVRLWLYFKFRMPKNRERRKELKWQQQVRNEIHSSLLPFYFFFKFYFNSKRNLRIYFGHSFYSSTLSTLDSSRSDTMHTMLLSNSAPSSYCIVVYCFFIFQLKSASLKNKKEKKMEMEMKERVVKLY